MQSINKQQEKTRLHVRNKNRQRYDLEALTIAIPALADYMKPNKYGDNSVDFSNPIAVKTLNKALLKHYYGIQYWEFPDENLCPPIPSRADYIHYMADLLGEHNFGKMPVGNKITCLDIGVGANCIYPILGVTEYDWNFIGTDIDAKSITIAQEIVNANPVLNNKIELRFQENNKDIFYGVLTRDDKIDLAVCNPPFHSSAEEALKGTQRKVKNLSGKKTSAPKLNFAGNNNELIYDGGESKFIQNMIRQSEKFSNNCYWFSTLVSKQSNLKSVYKSLKQFDAKQIKTIPMGTGNKSSRIVAWTFLSKEEQNTWKTVHWSTK